MGDDGNNLWLGHIIDEDLLDDEMEFLGDMDEYFETASLGKDVGPDMPSNASRTPAAMTTELFSDVSPEHQLEAESFQHRLDEVVGSPGEVYLAKLWSERFQRFRQGQGTDIESTPTADDMEQFIAMVPKVIAGRGKNDVLSYATLEAAITSIKRWSLVKFADFQLTVNEKRRQSNAMTLLLQDGVLTKERKFHERRWVTSDIVLRLAKSMLKNAAEKGTRSWDVVIMRTLSIVLQAATASRSSDIRLDPVYDTKCCLQWEHIHIRMKDVDGQKIFVATVDLKNLKGQKTNPTQIVAHEFTELMDPAFNCACPIKLLLVHALRHGAVAETSWDELRRNTWARRSKRVIWSHPQRPVLCDMGGRIMNLDKPSPRRAANAALQETVIESGLLNKIIPHDLRRGAARELAALDSSLGQNLELARRAMGHSVQTQRLGVTEHYTGHITHDTWKARLESVAPCGAKDGFQFSEERFNKRPTLADMRPRETDATQPALDDPDADEQESAGQSLDIFERWEIWRQKELAKQDEIPEDYVEVDFPADGSSTHLGQSNEAVTLSPLDGDPHDFARYLSTVNICFYQNDSDPNSLPKFAINGGSRDPATRFVLRCPKTGCNKPFLRQGLFDTHVKTCTTDLRQSYQFVCTECNKRYETEEQLETHKQRQHDYPYQPQRCNWPGCENDPTVYNTIDERGVHRSVMHFGRAVVCFIDGCENKKVYKTPAGLRAHLKKCHDGQVTEEMMKQHFPDRLPRLSKKVRFVPPRRLPTPEITISPPPRTQPLETTISPPTRTQALETTVSPQARDRRRHWRTIVIDSDDDEDMQMSVDDDSLPSSLDNVQMGINNAGLLSSLDNGQMKRNDAGYPTFCDYEFDAHDLEYIPKSSSKTAPLHEMGTRATKRQKHVNSPEPPVFITSSSDDDDQDQVKTEESPSRSSEVVREPRRSRRLQTVDKRDYTKNWWDGKDHLLRE